MANYDEGVTISQSFTSGHVTTNFLGYAGGLIGDATTSVIVDSYSNAQVDCAGEFAGGLAGGLFSINDGLDSFVYNSYATGKVTGYDFVGGLVGIFGGSNTEEDSAMYDSFATGQVIKTGEESVAIGGLVGYLGNVSNPSIWNSYWYDWSDYPEGFACYGFGEGGLGNDGCTAVTDLSEFQGEAVLSEIAVAWDFDGEDAIWKTVANDYPILFWQPDVEVEEEEPTPTPTPTPTPNNSGDSGSSSSSKSAPICSNQKPSSPDLFQINTTLTNAKLYFTPLSNTDTYVISFSTNPSAEEHGEQVTLTREGVQSHQIYFLRPNTTYYLKVRGQNGCAAGEWSNTMKVKTDANIYYKSSSPKKSLTSFQQNTVNKKDDAEVTTPQLEPNATLTLTPTPKVEQTNSNTNDQTSKKKCFLWWCW